MCFEYKLNLFPVQGDKCMLESTWPPEKKCVCCGMWTPVMGQELFFTQARKAYHTPGWKFCFGDPLN